MPPGALTEAPDGSILANPDRKPCQSFHKKGGLHGSLYFSKNGHKDLDTFQTAIATILSDMDTEITVLDTKLTKARALKQGMMQELLTGRVRLV